MLQGNCLRITVLIDSLTDGVWNGDFSISWSQPYVKDRLQCRVPRLASIFVHLDLNQTERERVLLHGILFSSSISSVMAGPSLPTHFH